MKRQSETLSGIYEAVSCLLGPDSVNNPIVVCQRSRVLAMPDSIFGMLLRVRYFSLIQLFRGGFMFIRWLSMMGGRRMVRFGGRPFASRRPPDGGWFGDRGMSAY
jgi:hypothetical protein